MVRSTDGHERGNFMGVCILKTKTFTPITFWNNFIIFLKIFFFYTD